MATRCEGYKTSVVLSLSAQVLLGDNYLWLLEHGEVYNKLNASPQPLDSESLGYFNFTKRFCPIRSSGTISAFSIRVGGLLIQKALANLPVNFTLILCPSSRKQAEVLLL